MNAGMPFLAQEWRRCMEKVAKLRRYPSKPLIDRVGWNGNYFALADGTVIPEPIAPSSKPIVLFPKHADKCASAGSIADWRTLTRGLRYQPLATFVLSAAYAGPFLALSDQVMNQGFELAGPGGVGKSTIQRLAAAVCGPADNPFGDNYWITANATINGLERVMAEHHDMPMIIEETNLFAAGDYCAKRAVKLNELVFRLADGTPKLRFGPGSMQRSRFLFLTSTNEPLAQLLFGARVAVAEAAADRLLTIPISAELQHGIFDSVPNGWDSSGDFAAYLNRATRKCYGVGIRQLLQGLTTEMAADREGLEASLRKLVEEFRREVGVDSNDGSETRVADAFGLAGAAGLFAVRYKAVSSKLDPMHAALVCYELNKALRSRPPSFGKQMRAIADDYDTILVDQDRLPELTDDDIDLAPAVLRTGRGGRRELLFTERQLYRSFGNLRSLFSDPEIQGLMITELGRKQTKRQIRRNRKADRVYCFRLPE